MTRPRVICHMMASIDGRIVVDHWPDLGEGRGEYERTAATFEAEAWMCGRVTMEAFATGLRDPDTAGASAGDVARADFVAPGAHGSYAVAVDASGRLAWETNEIGGDHIVAVLGEDVSDEYLARLRKTGISYVLAPAGDAGGLDLGVALEKLASAFGVRTLMLEGGGGINGSMLRAGLIDEVSLLVVPVADGTAGAATVFDSAERGADRLSLESVEKRSGGVVWLRYRVQPAPID